MNRVVRRAAVALLFLGVAAPASAQMPDADAIIKRFEQEIGVAGRNPYDGVTSIRTVMNISSPAMGMALDMQIDAVLPDKFVSRMSIPGLGEVRSGYDGTVAWSIDPMQGARLLDGPEFEQVRAQAADITEPGISRNLTSAETIGEDTVDGRKCWVVKLTMNSGVTADSCFDAENGLLVKQVASQGGVEVESYFHDYKAFGPVKMASRIVARAAGQEQILTIESVDYDAVDPAALRLPAEVQALIRN
ncbi:MAG: DUF620 domain-containing protein [Candidatus Cloacimonetes bacterium]|jgi:hypothetical protein|nr:DUF620 domain-containing protein [Candidatus Cloacimonadota bacterium]